MCRGTIFLIRRFMDNCYHLCLPVIRHSGTIFCQDDSWMIAINFACLSHNITDCALDQFFFDEVPR